jgi:hypothetical protein
MPTFIYVPFRGWEDDGGIVKQVNRNKQKYGLEVVLEGGNAKEQPLGDVKAGDLLIVVGHGLQPREDADDEAEYLDENNTVYANRREATYIKSAGQNVFKTANDLAKQMRDEGLSEDHGVIKCDMCFAGGFWVRHSGRMTDKYEEDNRTFFACHVARALFQQRCRNIVVGGPVGMLIVNGNPLVENQVGVTVVGSKNKIRLLRLARKFGHSKGVEHVHGMEATRGERRVDADDHYVWYQGSDGAKVARPLGA